jgi:hypothetical protein
MLTWASALHALKGGPRIEIRGLRECAGILTVI